VQPSEALFFHPEPPQYLCVTCHDLADRSLRLEIDQFENEADRRCDTCHHPSSDIYAQVEAIAGALAGAQGAYKSADAHIQEAAGVGMIVDDADVALSEAKTSLIQAQAAVHTTKLPLIAESASASKTKSEDAEAIAQARLDESVFRREAMVVVVGLIVLNVMALVLIRRRVERGRRGPEEAGAE
jgi:multidrug resistance efflux pump